MLTPSDATQTDRTGTQEGEKSLSATAELDDFAVFYRIGMGDAYSQGNISVDHDHLTFLHVSITDLNPFNP